MKLCAEAGPHEFVAMRIIGPLCKTTNENQYALVLRDLVSKITRFISTSRMKSAYIANSSLKH